MNFELTISGLCLIVVKAREGRWENPDEVEVLCVGAHRDHDHEHGHHHQAQPVHRPRLSYLPEFAVATVEPDLFVDPAGVRIASLDLEGKDVVLETQGSSHTEFSLQWGPTESVEPPEEGWMNWVPTLEDLGFDPFDLGDGNGLPPGAATRFILPKGELASRNVVRDVSSKNFIQWEFMRREGSRETRTLRALANEVVYKAGGISSVSVRWGEGSVHSSISEGTLRMTLSNDLATVPLNYAQGTPNLEHLRHLQGFDSRRSRFVAPRIVDERRTGHPICNQVMFLKTVG